MDEDRKRQFLMLIFFNICSAEISVYFPFMIKNTAELLQALMTAEAQKIAEQQIVHRTTIGNMYEGLTADLITKGIFRGFNLNVITNSFIVGADGQLTKEMDVLIIEGQGEKLPYTEQYKVFPEQVIAVIQVKKTLNKQQIEDAYFNLKNVYDISEFKHFPDYALTIFRNSFSQICKKDIVDRGKLRTTFASTTEEQIFHMLKLEALMPVRIVLGYEGYASEFGFREGFMGFLEDKKSTLEQMNHGYSPLYFPDLIINEGVSILKGKAMPYVGPMIDGQWAFYFSNSSNPIIHLLEMIWTRLSYRYDLSADIFGEDLVVDGLNTLLLCNMVNVDGMQGWNYEYVPTSKTELESFKDSLDWEPVKLSFEQHLIIFYLIHNSEVSTNEIGQLINADNTNFNLEAFVNELVDTKLVVVDTLNKMKLITEKCKTLFIPNDGFYAADDKTGRFARWYDKKFGEQNSKRILLKGLDDSGGDCEQRMIN
jgi:hypothetical protein